MPLCLLNKLMLTSLPDPTVPKMGYFSCLRSATYTGAVCRERENCPSESSPRQRVIEASLALTKDTELDLVLLQALSWFRFA